MIQAPPSAVYRALTEGEGLSGWWTTDAEAEPALGTVASFGFDDRSTVFRMRIEELLRDEFVRWHCVDGHPEWEHTEITFDLAATDDGGTILFFAHRGWESTDGILATCSFEWASYLMSLRDYLERGEGAPHGA